MTDRTGRRGPMGRFVATFCILIVCLLPVLASQDFTRERIVTQIILKYLAGAHFSPLELNDELSSRAFGLYIKRLDPGKRFLLKKDIRELKKHELSIDDELRQGRLDLFHRGMGILEKRIGDARTIVDSLLAEPLDFSKADSFEMDPEKRTYCDGLPALAVRWNRILTHQTMMRYFDAVTGDLDSAVWNTGAFDPAQSFRPDLAAEAQEREHRSTGRFFKRMLEQNRDNKAALYINAIVNSFDPHSSYLPPERKEDFDITMTGRLEGIGAVLQEDDGYIKVVRIVPGSASWRQKQLKPDDIILKVGQGSDEPEDIVEMMLSEAVKLIRGKKGTEVRLTVKKPDGRIMMIPIIRDVVIIEETYARSALVQLQEDGPRYGYVYLPRFYHDFNRKGTRNSSEDIRRELEKMHHEDIRGVIIDLRNNTGGSLDDAVKMAGLFIRKGPIVQSRGRRGNGEVLRDTDPDVHYEGPLVVLQNAHSASASEIVAAALQDYRRAVIVGPPHTFGKGTVQRLMNLDGMLGYRYRNLKPLGSLKITIQKFYRINGGATQYKGVEPDIVLPDPNDYAETGEKDMDYSLPWDEVDPLGFEPWSKFSYDMAALRKASAKRVSANQVFNAMVSRSQMLKERQKRTAEPLDLTTVWRRQREIRNAVQHGNELERSHINVRVSMLEADAARLNSDTDKLEKAKDWQEQRHHDPQLAEAINILNDINGL